MADEIKTFRSDSPLRMNLQFFSDLGEAEGEEGEGSQGTNGSQGKGNPEGTGGQSGKSGEGFEGQGGHEGSEGKGDKRSFTQDELDAIIQDRLARERKKSEDKQQKERDEAERKRLEEEEKYKELAENLQKQLDEQKADALKAKKSSLIAGAGYSDDQVELVAKLVDGGTDDEIKASLESVKKTFPPKKQYADPSSGNGRRQTPEHKDGEDIGSSAWERIKGRIGR